MNNWKGEVLSAYILFSFLKEVLHFESCGEENEKDRMMTKNFINICKRFLVPEIAQCNKTQPDFIMSFISFY